MGAVGRPLIVITRGVLVTLPALQTDVIKKPKGLGWKYQNHWIERGRAASVSNPDTTGRPRRSVAFGEGLPMSLNSITCISSLCAGLGLVVLGLLLRKQNKRNWKAFLFLGSVVFLSALASLRL
jgi:hypothetical protein